MQDVLDLSICIVNYTAQESLDECLHSIADNKGDVRVEVFVVDNASSDCSADMVSSHHPWVNLIANPRNVGFAAANNQALRLAKGRHVPILNPDTDLPPQTIPRFRRV